MKCRLCGYEIGGGKDYCPMCGTKVLDQAKTNFSAASTEIAWNTKDFPKPKQVEDIEMNWGNGFKSFMAQDASEGFVSVEKTASAAPKPQFTAKKADPFELPTQMQQNQQPTFISSQTKQPVYKYQPTATSTPVRPAPVQPRPQAPVSAPQPQPQVQIPQAPQMQMPTPPVRQSAPQPNFDAWKMPPQEEPPVPLWYTQNFTASGVMKTGPAFPLQQTQPMPPVQPVVQTPIMAQPMQQAPVMPQAVTAQQAAAAFSAAVPDATIEFMRVDAPQPVFPQEYVSPEAYKPNYDNIPTQAQKAPEQFNTFVAKNEEFQALLDREYARIRAAHREDTSPLNAVNKAFANETKIKAQPIREFERSIFDDASPIGEEIKVAANAAAIAQAVKPVEEKPKSSLAFAYDKDETSISLEDLIADPLSPRFDIDTLELTIKKLELEEQKLESERQYKQSKLQKMKEAREAYFRILDGSATSVNLTPVAPKVEEKPQPKVEAIPATKIQSEVSPIRFNKYQKTDKETTPEVEEPTIEIEPKREVKPEVAPAPVEPVKVPEVAAVEEIIEEKTPVEEVEVFKEEIPAATEAPEAEEETPEEIKPEVPAVEEIIEENNAEEKTLEMDKDYTASLEAKLKEIQDMPEELDGLYTDDSEEDEPKSHGFLKFLLALVIIIVLLAIAVFALERFLPESEVTAIAVSIKDAVVAVAQNLVSKIKK